MCAVISYDEATGIARRFAEEIAAAFPGKIRAVFAIGSLGSDYYRPGQSDIDTAVITDFSRAELAPADEAIGKIADRYQREYDVPKGFGAVVFAAEQLLPPYIKEEELVLEILRLKTQARLLWGEFDTNSIPTPGREAIIEDARAFEAWREAEAACAPDFGVSNVTMLVNSTLMILKRYLMIGRGVIEFNKCKVIGEYLRCEPPITDAELFDFIEATLRGQMRKISGETFARMTARHDEIYRTINSLVL